MKDDSSWRTPVERVLTAFLNIFKQLPGAQYNGRDFRLLVIEQQTYLLLCADNRITVFDIQAHLPLPVEEHQCSGFEYLCTRLTPAVGGAKQYRMAFDCRRKLHHGARMFCAKVGQRFNLKATQEVAARLGVKA